MPRRVGLGGRIRTADRVCEINASIDGKAIVVQAFVTDELGTDESGRPIEVLFGAMAMQQWNIRVIPGQEHLDLTHYIEEAAAHSACKAFLDGIQAGGAPWHVAWQNIYEFLRYVTRPNYFKRALTFSEAFLFIDALTVHPRLAILAETERHRDCMAEALKTIPDLRGIFFHDVHIAALCLEHGIRKIATTDIEFRKFPFLEVINPTG